MLTQNEHACFTGALHTKCVAVNMVVTVMQDYIKCQYGANSNTSLTTNLQILSYYINQQVLKYNILDGVYISRYHRTTITFLQMSCHSRI